MGVFGLIGNFRNLVITIIGLIVLSAVLLFFFPNQLFAVAIAGVGGFLLLNEAQRKLKDRDRTVMGLGLFILLISSLIFTGLVAPFSIVGLYPETSPQGTIPFVGTNVKPNVVTAAVSDELKGQFQYTYTTFCSFVKTQDSFSPGETGNIVFSVDPLPNIGSVPNPTDTYIYYAVQNGVLELNGEKVSTSFSLNGGSGGCANSTGSLVRLADNLYGFPVNINEGGGTMSFGYSVPNNLAPGDYQMVLKVGLGKRDRFGNFSTVPIEYFDVLSWDVVVVDNTVVVPPVEEPVVEPPVVTPQDVQAAFWTNVVMLVAIISVIGLVVGIAYKNVKKKRR